MLKFTLYSVDSNEMDKSLSHVSRDIAIVYFNKVKFLNCIRYIQSWIEITFSFHFFKLKQQQCTSETREISPNA